MKEMRRRPLIPELQQPHKMALSRKERQQLQREERAGTSSSEEKSPQSTPQQKTKSRLRLYAAIGAVVVLLISIGFAAYYWLTPGPYDDFAKCLSSKGAVMYGAMGWCEYTQGQKAMFGKSFRHLNYHEFGDYPEEYGEIKKTPTWIINGKVYENTQSFGDLSRLTGCQFK